jgi:hypothetical protein
MKSTLAIKLLLASLSHRLRTPMSVVSNDLQYFHKKDPQLEADKTLNSINNMAQTLSQAENLSNIFSEIVATKNYKKLFEFVSETLSRDYQWDLDLISAENIKLSIKNENSYSASNICGIARMYSDLFKKESIEILLIDSACADLNITQEVTIDENFIKISFTHF